MVKNRRRGRDKGKREANHPLAESSGITRAHEGKGTVRETPRRRRPSNNAVVAIKVENGDSTSYADILKKARQRINIKDIGITNPKIRKMANGGVLLEIPGPDGQARADALTSRLKKEVGDSAKISRPVKFGELQINGIDLSVSPDELVQVLATSGQCELETI